MADSKPVVRKGVDIDLVDIIHPLKYMIDMSRNLINSDGSEKSGSLDLKKYIEKYIIKKIIAVFDVDNNMLLSGDELRPVFKEYLGIYLSDQEAATIEA
jgi:Ca2+-binding EF-hand superfamily protein